MSELTPYAIQDSPMHLDSLELQPLIQRQSPPRVLPIAIFTFYGALIAGTGGAFETSNIPRLSEWTTCPVIQVQVREKQEKQAIAVPGVADSLRVIRDIFGLKMSELAQVFGVSRQAAYDWLAGTVPRQEITARIWELSRTAELLRSAGITRMEHFVHRPMLDGNRTLFSLLLSGENIDGAVQQIKELARAESVQRTRKANRKTGTDAGDASSVYSMGTPILSEGKES
jgi:DNA-binding XRE family transcriptional regulator